MARVYGDKFSVELSYIDLCELLAEDIQDDESMPEGTRERALEVLGFLEDTLSPYSA